MSPTSTTDSAKQSDTRIKFILLFIVDYSAAYRLLQSLLNLPKM